MATKHTVSAIRQELRRRMDWYEKSYPRIGDYTNWDADRLMREGKGQLMFEIGRYQALRTVFHQLAAHEFIGGGM